MLESNPLKSKLLVGGLGVDKRFPLSVSVGIRVVQGLPSVSIIGRQLLTGRPVIAWIAYLMCVIISIVASGTPCCMLELVPASGGVAAAEVALAHLLYMRAARGAYGLVDLTLSGILSKCADGCISSTQVAPNAPLP